MSQALLKFQIGPVQDFIAQARSTRDLWSGSYLLSWLVAAGIRRLIAEGGLLIFPNPDGQPLLKATSLWPNEDQAALLTPNLPNLFVAQVPAAEAARIARDVKAAIIKEWDAIAKSVWNRIGELGIDSDKKSVFDRQVAQHLSIAWQITPIGDRGYAEAYRNNGWRLDAVRQTRDFNAAGGGQWIVGNEKDSLSGKDEALSGGTHFADAMKKRCGEIPSLFKHSDHVGAVTLIKRIWHVSHLRAESLKTRSREFVIPSIPAIAARSDELDDERSVELTDGDKYVAAIAFDGDAIGQWVDGKDLPPRSDLLKHHQDFSAALGAFALKRVREIVETDHTGFLIYAGGDNVVALVPADAALACAKALRTAFRNATDSIKDKEGDTPDASAGIAIAHVHSPLQDLIRAAQKAEKRAKNTVGRPAFSVTLMKRSGEITEWGSQWASDGYELYEKIATLMGDGKLSGKFPHRVCQLLEPYVIAHCGLTRAAGTMQDVDGFDATEIIRKEFAFAAKQQGSPAAVDELEEFLEFLAAYVGKVREAREKAVADKKSVPLSESQTLLTSVIGLCTTVAFAHRTRLESKTSELSAVA